MPYRTEISLSSLPLRVIGPAALEELSITAQIRTVVDLLVQYEIVKGYAPVSAVKCAGKCAGIAEADLKCNCRDRQFAIRQ